MARQIFAYIVHKNKKADDTAFEIPAAAEKIDSGATVTALVFGSGDDVDAVCNEVSPFYDQVWKIGHEGLAQPNAEVIRRLLLNLLPGDGVLIVPHDTFGLDLSPGLSVKLDSPYLPDIVDIGEVSGNSIKAVRQEYSGMVSTHVECDMSNGLVMNLRGGSFAPVENGSKNGEVADKTEEALGGDLPEVKRKFIEVIEAEVGEVDITKSDVLVSVGRGIEDQDNLDMVFELAEAMGADVSCSRPIVDSKWMEKSRQVGTSGQTVKPRVYIALGISGAFQHIGGIKGSPFIVAINKNPKAPIFQSADIGIVADILDFIPELAEKIEEIKG